MWNSQAPSPSPASQLQGGSRVQGTHNDTNGPRTSMMEATGPYRRPTANDDKEEQGDEGTTIHRAA